MITVTSTRRSKSIKAKPAERTEYQLHKTQQTIFNGIINDVFDFTEYKLVRYIDDIEDKQEQQQLVVVLKDYVDGNVAVGWNKGVPVWIRITKG